MQYTRLVLAMALFIFLGVGCATNIPVPDTIATQTDTQVQTSEEFIRLTSPQTGQVVKSPFLIGGEARVSGNRIYIRVKNTQGDVLISEQARVSVDENTVGPFGILIRYDFRSTDSGIVEIYAKNSASGNEELLQSVPVTFDLSGSGSATSAE